MAGKTMQLRRDGKCVDCGVALAAGTTAVWYADERVVRCEVCAAQGSGRSAPAPTPSTIAPGQPTSTAGGSAQREYQRRSAKETARKQKAIDDDAEWRRKARENRPILGKVVTALTPKPQMTPESQATKAWKIGAEGERRVAEVLGEVAGIASLHDRLVPGSSANIDHIVVAPSGVYVIDAKKYTGKVETKNHGVFFRPDVHLYVGGRDRTKLVDGVLAQVNVVKGALGSAFPSVGVHGVLCFVGCNWDYFMRPLEVKGVTALWPMKLPEIIAVPSPHSEQIPAIAAHLASRLRPARS